MDPYCVTALSRATAHPPYKRNFWLSSQLFYGHCTLTLTLHSSILIVSMLSCSQQGVLSHTLQTSFCRATFATRSRSWFFEGFTRLIARIRVQPIVLPNGTCCLHPLVQMQGGLLFGRKLVQIFRLYFYSPRFLFVLYLQLLFVWYLSSFPFKLFAYLNQCISCFS